MMKLFNYVFSDRKKSLLVLLLALLSLSPVYAQQGYAVFDSSTGTLTFKYGTPTGTYYDADNTNIPGGSGTSGGGPGWRTYYSSIKKVVFDSSFDTARPTSCYRWFYQCPNLIEIEGIQFLHTDNVKSMAYMFTGCSSLTSLDVSNFNTENVTNMYYMFNGCSSLTSLDVSNFNTENVTMMRGMFVTCSSLTSLDLSNFNTANVTSFQQMFNGCSSLTSLDLSSFNTAKATRLDAMFLNCSGLTKIIFGKYFSLASSEDGSSMFNVGKYTRNLRYIDFYDCDNISAVPSVGRTSGMFSGVPKTTIIYLPHGSNKVTSENVIYSKNGNENDLWCSSYYSEDKVDIELPRPFQANEAKYSRTMNAATKYGTTILPYAFESNDEVQAYTLHHELTDAMYFEETATVPAHTPFFYQKKNANATTVNFNMADATDGITVNATHTTSAAEGGEPYQTGSGMTDWATKGYYITETIDAYNNGTFYISGDKFLKAMGTVKMNPHRVTFHGEWTMDPSTSSSNIMPFELLDGDDVTNSITDALEAADQREAVNGARAIYDAQGRQHTELQKGLNIVLHKDGSVRKVFVR